VNPPAGWRELLPEEVLTKNDLYLRGDGKTEPPSGYRIGKTYNTISLANGGCYIRKEDAPQEEAVDSYGRPMWFMEIFNFQECEFPSDDVIKRCFVPLPSQEKVAPGDMIRRSSGMYETCADWVFTSKDSAVKCGMTAGGYAGLIRHVDSPYWACKLGQKAPPVKRRRSAVTSFSDPLPLP
jgi:hypothetical protein